MLFGADIALADFCNNMVSLNQPVLKLGDLGLQFSLLRGDLGLLLAA